MNLNQAIQMFTLGKYHEPRHDPLTIEQFEVYKLMNERVSNGMTATLAITEVAKILGHSRGTVQSRFKYVQEKGWM